MKQEAVALKTSSLINFDASLKITQFSLFRAYRDGKYMYN